MRRQRFSISKCCHASMNSPVTEAVRTVHWTSISSPATLSSASFSFLSVIAHSASSKVDPTYHYCIVIPHVQYTWTLSASHVDLLSLCTRLQMPGCWYFIRPLDCSIICIQRYNEGWPHAPSCIFLQVVYENFTSGILDIYHLLWPWQLDFNIRYNYDLNNRHRLGGFYVI